MLTVDDRGTSFTIDLASILLFANSIRPQTRRLWQVDHRKFFPIDFPTDRGAVIFWHMSPGPIRIRKLTAKQTGHLIYQCGGIDKRTVEKFEKASLPNIFFSFGHFPVA